MMVYERIDVDSTPKAIIGCYVGHTIFDSCRIACSCEQNSFCIPREDFVQPEDERPKTSIYRIRPAKVFLEKPTPRGFWWLIFAEL